MEIKATKEELYNLIDAVNFVLEECFEKDYSGDRYTDNVRMEYEQILYTLEKEYKELEPGVRSAGR